MERAKIPIGSVALSDRGENILRVLDGRHLIEDAREGGWIDAPAARIARLFHKPGAERAPRAAATRPQSSARRISSIADLAFAVKPSLSTQSGGPARSA